MARSTFEDPEELIACPYDPVHMVARKRMPYHLLKCAKNFSRRDYSICPFNARHVVPKQEFDDHISNCEDRGRVEAEMLREQEEAAKEGMLFKGNTSVPSSNFVTESTESWDDSDYVVEIKPQLGGLFSDGVSSKKQESVRPKPPKVQVSNPPVLRMPRSTPGAGSEVFEYSMQRQREEQRQLPQYQPPQGVPIGRGRGRGRGRGAAASQFAAAPVSIRPGGGGALRYPPGFAPPTQAQTTQTSTKPELTEEELDKRERKLKKMLRQIETLEEKKERGEKLDSDQEAKLLRKQDVIVQLEQAAKLREQATCS